MPLPVSLSGGNLTSAVGLCAGMFCWVCWDVTVEGWACSSSAQLETGLNSCSCCLGKVGLDGLSLSAQGVHAGPAHPSTSVPSRASGAAPLHHLQPRSLCLPPHPVEHSVRDPLLSPAAAKLCELSWSILERGMLFIFILCIFCLGLLITFVPQERQLPQ